MTSKRRGNINLVSFICLSFLVISFSKQLLIIYFIQPFYRNFASKIKGLSQLTHSCSSVAIKRFKRLLCIIMCINVGGSSVSVKLLPDMYFSY